MRAQSLSQFCSVAQSCPTLCDPMDCSTPGFPVHHQLPELAQTHILRVGDAIQPSHPLSSPSPPAFRGPHRLMERVVAVQSLSTSLQPHELQHARLPCPSLSLGVCSNSCPLSQSCHPTISSSVCPFSTLNISQHQGLFQ